MSVNIDAKKFRKAFFTLDQIKAIPIFVPPVGSYDGEWIEVVNPSGYGYAITSRNTFQKHGSSGKADPTLSARVSIICVGDDTDIFYLYFAPHKDGWEELQGIRHDGTKYCCESWNAGIETETEFTGYVFTVEHELRILHAYDKSFCKFTVDGAEVANHTTNISDQPFQICCCEANFVARTIKLKYPVGISA